MTNSHDQLGWNCIADAIGLGFDSPNTWHLCRESRWREAPTGIPYNVAIQMRLKPGVEKESDEALCGLFDTLPWWNPDEADREMWDARRWLDEDWLQKQAAFNDSMHKENPRNDGYEKALDEILRQLCLLEDQKPKEKDSGKTPTVTRWVNLSGEPGQHGDVIRFGFGEGQCYLEITNDGFPNPGASGGMMVPVPEGIVMGSKLDARKFMEFYRSVYPGGHPIYDFSDPIWIYEPTPGRPAGSIEVVQHLSTKENKQNGAFDFEKQFVKREMVKAEDAYYIRITEYQCSAEANGRPVYSYTENYHVCGIANEALRLKLLTADSGLDFAAKTPAYRYEEQGTGVLF